MEHSVTAGVLLYGIFGLISAFGLFRRRAWNVGTSIAWAIAVTYVPGVAVMAYGDEGASLSSAIAASRQRSNRGGGGLDSLPSHT